MISFRRATSYWKAENFNPNKVQVRRKYVIVDPDNSIYINFKDALVLSIPFTSA